MRLSGRFRFLLTLTVAQSWRMQRSRQNRVTKPLDPDTLQVLALAYVARYATTRKKLADYLHRKIRERQWDSGGPPDIKGIVQKFADVGFVDDAAFAATKGRALTRRGYGAARIRLALDHAGVGDEWTPPNAQSAFDAAETYARRRRIGPFASAPGDDKTVRRHATAMLRAGHSSDLAWKFARALPNAEIKYSD
jgi:regulatory protein